ncbi:MAG: shikimate kinase [Firmicutes bacterium]|nr:shikimate kinase [Bacillota bacterium]
MISKALALIGMMGAGKSTVAQLVARDVGCPWYDLDSEIVREVGKDVPAIFRSEGEAAFRRYEREVLRRLLATRASPFVLATGGGTPVSPDNQELLRSACWVVWLDADARVLYARAASPERPLTEGGETAFLELWRQRRAAYESASHWRLDVARLAAESVAERITAWWHSVDKEGAGHGI